MEQGQNVRPLDGLVPARAECCLAVEIKHGIVMNHDF